MFTIRGYDEGVAYALAVDPDQEPGADGLVAAGPPGALALLRVHEGERVRMTPTGPEAEIRLTDPQGIVAGLMEYTEITDIVGDVPAGVLPESVADRIY
jgi:hypothetical protein